MTLLEERRVATEGSATRTLSQMFELVQEIHTRVFEMATQAELQASLTAVGDQLTKASAEISAEIVRLQEAVAAGGMTTPEVDASVERLKTLAESLDAMNPDAPPVEPTP